MRWTEAILYLTIAVYVIAEWGTRSLMGNLLCLAVLVCAWTAGHWHTPWHECDAEDCPRLNDQLRQWEEAKQNLKRKKA